MVDVAAHLVESGLVDVAAHLVEQGMVCVVVVMRGEAGWVAVVRLLWLVFVVLLLVLRGDAGCSWWSDACEWKKREL